jgi:hypothetical protein
MACTNREIIEAFPFFLKEREALGLYSRDPLTVRSAALRMLDDIRAAADSIQPITLMKDAERGLAAEVFMIRDLPNIRERQEKSTGLLGEFFHDPLFEEIHTKVISDTPAGRCVQAAILIHSLELAIYAQNHEAIGSMGDLLLNGILTMDSYEMDSAMPLYELNKIEIRRAVARLFELSGNELNSYSKRQWNVTDSASPDGCSLS